jgi:hypothetical protein
MGWRRGPTGMPLPVELVGEQCIQLVGDREGGMRL